MFKVGDFVYAYWDFNGSYFGRIMSINPESSTPYEVKIYYYGTGHERKTIINNRFFTSDVRLAQDEIAEEIEMYQNKIDMLRKMNMIETAKDLEKQQNDN